MRAARLEGQASPAWWKSLLLNRFALTAAAGAAAALALAAISLRPADSGSPTGPEIVKFTPPQDSYAEIQEVTETEALSAAVDQLDDFTDSELVCLIGL